MFYFLLSALRVDKLCHFSEGAAPSTSIMLLLGTVQTGYLAGCVLHGPRYCLHSPSSMVFLGPVPRLGSPSGGGSTCVAAAASALTLPPAEPLGGLPPVLLLSNLSFIRSLVSSQFLRTFD